MGPIEIMVEQIIVKKMQEDFPQVQLPAVMQAKVTKVSKLEEYRYEDFRVTCKNNNDSETFIAEITGNVYEYNLKILTKDGEPNLSYPEIPGVKSKIPLKVGSTAAVVLLYGDLRPYIIGEAL